MRENEAKWRILRENLENCTIRKCLKVSSNEKIKFLFIGQGQVETWHYLKCLPEASSLRNLEKIQFRMIVRSGKCIGTNFVFLEHFACLCEISFHFSPFVLQPKPILFHFARLCEFSACSCEIEKHSFSTTFCHFSHFFLLNPPQPPSIQLQRLVQVHCLFLIIHIVYSLQFHFYFVTQCFKNHLKISPQLHKTISISYKGSNVLLEHIRHNYYSKCMKLVRISI